jgi:hypothetical protein|tara:strand:+ start:825 stop:1370 length:546 start_codon:yes stop_codon:yes gene_type:complete
MNTHASYELFDTHKGVQYRQNTNIDEFNSRLNGRQFADSPLEPNFDMRSVSTKYARFPIVNRRKPVMEDKLPYVDYNQGANFTPAVSRGPVSGYMNGIDTETILRNQTFGLQHGIGQDLYVPSSNSELYNVSVVSRPSDQPHMGLFTKNTFSNRPHPNVDNSTIGRDKFFNHTRTQLRNSA